MTDWKLFAIGSALFAGLTAVLAKVGVEEIPSNLATLLRTLVIVGFLCVLVAVRHEWRDPSTLNRRSVFFLVCSAIATGLSWLCYYRALQTGPASMVAPIDKLSVVIAVGLSIAFLGERLDAIHGVGVLLIAAGVLILAIK